MASLSLSQHNLWPPESGSTAFRGFAIAVSVNTCHHVRRHLRLGFHLRSSLEKLHRFSDDARMEFARYQRVLMFNGANFMKYRAPSSSSYICFFNGGDSSLGPRGEEGASSSSSSSSSQERSKRNILDGRRRWTNILLAINVIMYVAQVASNGKVLTWGAKVNSLVDKGQIWRLATCSVLHANPMHLMINCYSLNSIGPTAESLGGPKRFLAVYLTSAIASSAMSYWFNKSPSVGASGAIFGLVGSLAVFVVRHKRMVRGGNEDLMQIAQIIALNMTMGLMSKGIDNWGHIGGLLGGTAMAWLVGPQWKYDYTTRDGRRVFMDNAPLPLLTRWRNGQRRL